ncbi:MAG TPA: glycosyltransferase family 2 protein, partial [Methylomirabilota bacterium]|nr:glycosyltransferase family 2 protein [Methylomirabilota bacterium]
RAVHESITVDGDVARLRGHLVHRSYRDVADFLARADRYTSLAADEWVAAGRPSRPLLDMVVRPIGRFLSMYVARAGFLDGWRGFLLATLYAYYVLMRSAKIWERTKR